MADHFDHKVGEIVIGLGDEDITTETLRHREKTELKNMLSQVSAERLESYVRKLEGLRHGWENYDELEKRASVIEAAFRSFGLCVENQEVPFHGRTFRNIIATLKGDDNAEGWLLLGAHYDAAWGSPGADDNASGIAILLEAADILGRLNLRKTVQFVAFTLEEPQPQTIHFLIGSDFFAKEAKRSGTRYEAVIVLESVGYTDNSEGSQFVPFFVRAPVPKKGNFLGIIANRRSRDIMEAFYNASKNCVPGLSLVPYRVPFSGRIIPESRFSDHASFWNRGYPALMLTDTAMFRNPHYHTPHDRHETLDFCFMSDVARAVICAILKLGNFQI